MAAPKSIHPLHVVLDIDSHRPRQPPIEHHYTYQSMESVNALHIQPTYHRHPYSLCSDKSLHYYSYNLSHLTLPFLCNIAHSNGYSQQIASWYNIPFPLRYLHQIGIPPTMVDTSNNR